VCQRQALVTNAAFYRDVYARRLAERTSSLPPEALRAAEETGRARDLRETARSVVAELERDV
jgi:hypothetical protein